MEGYANVDSSHEDFDDLDIEGRHARIEEQSGEEDSIERKKVERLLLSLKVKVDDDTFGYVFSLKTSNGVARWKCHLCDVLIVSQEHVDTHIQSKKHQLKLALPLHPRYLFGRIESIKSEKHADEMPRLAPGEPVPPGFEDVVRRVAQMQTTLDNYKKSSIIGLEYLVELTPDERGKEPLYVCMLCDKKGDPRVAMAHLTSFNHTSKYIGIHFPTASKIINTEYPRAGGKKTLHVAMSHLCSKIEERYGRLQPVVVDKDYFEKNKDEIIKQIESDRHLRENPSATFVECVSKEVIESLMPPEEVPAPPEEKPSVDQKSTFNKGKITCDRSRLRARNSEEAEEEDVFKKLAELERQAEESKKAEEKSSVQTGVKRKKTDPEVSERKSLSSVSSFSSSSLSPSKSRSRSRSRSRYDYQRFRRYKRHSGRSRRSRSHSWSPYARSGSRRSRSRSRDSKGRRWHQRSRSPQYRKRSPFKDGRGKIDRPKHQDKKREDFDDPLRHERNKWVRFRQEADKLEREITKQLKYHEKNPEKHPLYPDEWKKFWNRRYKELQAENKDPSNHDFKPEWIEFWNKRMKELHEEEIKAKKQEWKVKLGLPNEEELPRPKFYQRKNQNPPPTTDDDIIVISPPASEKNDRSKKDVTVADIKNTWRALTGSDIKDSGKRSPSPWEDQEPYRDSSAGRMSPRPGRWWQDHPGKGGSIGFGGRERMGRYHNTYADINAVTVLRFLTAMENQLGSLGPRINTLLAQALALERTSPGFSQSLLESSENMVLFETVREKLKGQLLAGIVPRSMVLATRSCVHNLTELLAAERSVPAPRVIPSRSREKPVAESIPEKSRDVKPCAAPVEPVAVPGVGVVDKVAIAQQIAAALVAQGRTDVSQEELQQLINAVVGMAQASADAQQPISAAAFVAQQTKKPTSLNNVPSTPDKNEESPFQMLLSTVTSRVSAPAPGAAKSDAADEPRVSGLQLLQSAYDEKRSSPGGSLVIKTANFAIDTTPRGKVEETPSNSKFLTHFSRVENMDDLSENDLQTLLHNFKDLSSPEQHCLITYLKSVEEKDPERVERLRKYVNVGQSETNQTLPQHTLRNEDTSSTFPSGRLSPFSMRLGGINPSQDDRGKREEESTLNENSTKMDDSDDDYSFEDIYAAASKKVKERENARQAEQMSKTQVSDAKKVEDSKSILRETKEIIANLMGQLPGKFIPKQSPRNDGPAQPNFMINPGQDSTGQRISTLCGGNISLGPTLDIMGHPTPLPPEQKQELANYDPNASYNSQYGSQGSAAAGYQQGVQNYSTSGNYGGEFNNYYNNQSHYPQQTQGGYTGSYPDQQPASYPNQQPFRSQGSAMYNQFSGQSSGYY